MTRYQQVGPDEPQGWSPFAVSMIATLVLLLGLGGALFGIYVANVNAAASTPTTPPTTSTSTTAPVTSPPVTSPPVTTNPPATTTPPVTTTGPVSFPLPKLTGLDFEVARANVRELGLDWTLSFGASGSDRSVTSTNPRAGTAVHKGARIEIAIKGKPPAAHVPAIDGQACAKAVGMIIDAGLYPEFLTDSRTGAASAPEQDGLVWNDYMKLTCGS